MNRAVTGTFRYRGIALAVVIAVIGWLGIPALSAAEKSAPTELNIAIPCLTAIEQPWVTGLIQALERVKAEKPHGLTINWRISENALPPDGERGIKAMGGMHLSQVIGYDVSSGHCMQNKKIDRTLL